MMFGIPGAALAMVKCAKPGKKKVAIGLVASAALCAFICGVTEPFEFGFMFLAPVLYVIYAALYGIFTMITVALGFRAGFSFSAGAMDLFFSASLPAAAKIWLIIPLGIAAFLVFYFVFLFAMARNATNPNTVTLSLARSFAFGQRILFISVKIPLILNHFISCLLISFPCEVYVYRISCRTSSIQYAHYAFFCSL